MWRRPWLQGRTLPSGGREIDILMGGWRESDQGECAPNLRLGKTLFIRNLFNTGHTYPGVQGGQEDLLSIDIENLQMKWELIYLSLPVYMLSYQRSTIKINFIIALLMKSLQDVTQGLTNMVDCRRMKDSQSDSDIWPIDPASSRRHMASTTFQNTHSISQAMMSKTHIKTILRECKRKEEQMRHRVTFDTQPFGDRVQDQIGFSAVAATTQDALNL